MATSVKYEDIFSYFLGQITDYDFLHLDDAKAYEIMTEQLHGVISEPYIRRLFSSITADDELQTLEFEMAFNTDDFSDIDFITRVLSKGMVVEWLTPQVRSKIATSQMFATKEQKFYAQSSHLSQLRSLLEDTQLEVRKLIRDRGYIYNSYLEES